MHIWSPNIPQYLRLPVVITFGNGNTSCQTTAYGTHRSIMKNTTKIQYHIGCTGRPRHSHWNFASVFSKGGHCSLWETLVDSRTTRPKSSLILLMIHLSLSYNLRYSWHSAWSLCIDFNRFNCVMHTTLTTFLYSGLSLSRELGQQTPPMIWTSTMSFSLLIEVLINPTQISWHPTVQLIQQNHNKHQVVVV